LLGLDDQARGKLVDQVRRSSTFPAPFVIVLPVAIFQ
jgi:hypothetical protein